MPQSDIRRRKRGQRHRPETADARLRNPGVDRFVIRRGGRRIRLPRQRVASATGIGKEQGQKPIFRLDEIRTRNRPSAFPVETTTKRPLHVRHTEPAACSNHNSTARGRHVQVSRRPPLPSSAIRRPDLRNEPPRRFGWPKAEQDSSCADARKRQTETNAIAKPNTMPRGTARRSPRRKGQQQIADVAPFVRKKDEFATLKFRKIMRPGRRRRKRTGRRRSIITV